jgi:O-antigen ligase
VARRFSDRDVMHLTLFAMGAYLAIGVASEIGLGTFRPWISGYRFSGTCHPNGQALDSAMLFIALVFAHTKKGGRAAPLLAAAIIFVFLVLTKSRTSVAGALAAPLIFVVLVSTASGRITMGSFLGALACGGIVAGGILGPILRKVLLMGRVDTTVGQATSLTGRTDLWQEAFEQYISRRPLLGYGFNSFWNTDRVEDFAHVVDFQATSAHSAYVDLLLGLGPVGLIAYVLAHLFAIGRCVALYRATKENTYLFFGGILVYVLLHGIMESGFLFMALSTFISMSILVKVGFARPPEEYFEHLKARHTGPLPASMEKPPPAMARGAIDGGKP